MSEITMLSRMLARYVVTITRTGETITLTTWDARLDTTAVYEGAIGPGVSALIVRAYAEYHAGASLWKTRPRKISTATCADCSRSRAPARIVTRSAGTLRTQARTIARRSTTRKETIDYARHHEIRTELATVAPQARARSPIRRVGVRMGPIRALLHANRALRGRTLASER